MGVYTRFKRDPEGLRALVELLETTPLVRKQKMIEVGMIEDANFTQMALIYVYTFEDIITLPDMELAELLSVAPPRISAMAIQPLESEVHKRFIKNAKSPIGAQIKEFLDTEYTLQEVGGAQLRLIEMTRKLEAKDRIRTKKIPLLFPE